MVIYMYNIQAMFSYMHFERKRRLGGSHIKLHIVENGHGVVGQPHEALCMVCVYDAIVVSHF